MEQQAADGDLGVNRHKSRSWVAEMGVSYICDAIFFLCV